MQNVVVNCSSKIWIFWNDELKGKVEYGSQQQITLQFVHSVNRKELWITSIYARCNTLERLELWEELEEISKEVHQTWIVGGDFNVILNKEEKLGGLDVTFDEIIDFAKCVNNCIVIPQKFKQILEPCFKPMRNKLLYFGSFIIKFDVQ